MVSGLDDPFIINRQFARINIEKLLDIRLADFGYRYYMTQDERTASIRAIRDEVARRAKQVDLGPRNP